MNSDSIKSKIDRKEQDMATNHVSFFFGARAFGALAFSLIGGFALEYGSKSTVFLACGTMPFLLFFYTFFFFEENKDSVYSEDATAEEIRSIVESHIKQIAPNYEPEETRIEEDSKSIHYDDVNKDQDQKIKNLKIKPSENTENYKPKTIIRSSEKKKESGLINNIKSKLGFKKPQEDSEAVVKSKKTNAKYNFSAYDKDIPSMHSISNSCYSVSDDFSMLYNQQNPNFFRDLQKILYVLRHPKIKRVILLVSLVMITPSFGSTWNYYLTNVIKLQPADMGELNFMASGGYLIGIIAMNTIFSGIKLKTFYRGTTIISSILLSSGLVLLFNLYKVWGINPKVFCALNSIVSNFVNEINILPILALCCRFCPKKLEAMSYAVFMSITWITYIFSQLFGVVILYYFKVSQDDFSNFWKCIIFQTFYGCTMAVIISMVEFPENFSDVTEFINSN